MQTEKGVSIELEKENVKMEKLNLQLFAENTEVEETQTEETQASEKEFDIQSILNNPEFIKHMESYADKRVTGALTKKEKEYQAQLEAERKKASMTQEELQQEKERELLERENQLKQYELKLSKLDYFKEKGYNIELLDFVGGTDEEEIKSNSDKLIEIVNKAVEKVVQERLKKDAYAPPTTQVEGKLSLADMENMSIEEINKIWDKVAK
ncbi:DUF4355 domain-containing protein [Tissierella sp. DSM 105185]|uniref:DUF4355 domain-containing protein n=2 Tax=Tissierella pigra TaxID=2607614 RepID=A0A6N7XKU1_9FIRM|nr:DUF4355 domain-containing protein [Tissierella pigra]